MAGRRTTSAPSDPTLEDEIAEAAPPTGLRVYFAVATVMFVLVGAAYLMRMGMGTSVGSIGGRRPSRGCSG